VRVSMIALCCLGATRRALILQPSLAHDASHVFTIDRDVFPLQQAGDPSAHYCFEAGNFFG
jgi:hypothetical protein